MKSYRLPAVIAVTGLVSLLSGCVVAPVGRPVAYYPAAQPAYVEPSAVVVVPAPRYVYPRYRHWRY